MTSDINTPHDLEPTLLNNNGGAALALPAELPLQPIDTSGWKLVHDDRVMFEARSKAALDMRANKAMALKKPLLNDTAKKKSMRDIMSECM